MSQSITPPVEPPSHFPEPPKTPTRSQILDQYWPEFLSIQLRDYEKRKSSGWGVAKGLFNESEFWEFMVANHAEVVKEMIGENE